MIAPRRRSRPRPATGRLTRLALALAAALATAPLAPAQAQERERACRCVDEEGREIEGCRCEITGRLGRVPRAPHVRLAPMPPMPPGAPHVRVWSMVGNRRVRLGITLGPEGDAAGAPVEDVLEGGPADRAGLRPGDVIVSLDGHDLSRPLDGEAEGRVILRGSPAVARLLEVLSELEPGEEVEVTYLREGERSTATLTPEENPGWQRMERVRERLGAMGERLHVDDARLEEIRERMEEWSFFGRGRCPEGGGSPGSPGRTCVAGAELLELNPELGAYFGAEEGVLVPEIDDDSPLGLRAGDVIVAVDGRSVASPDDVRRILRSYEEGEEVTFRILRQRQTMEVRGRVDR